MLEKSMQPALLKDDPGTSGNRRMPANASTQFDPSGGGLSACFATAPQ
ncbi:hypothetical protein ACTNDP_18470 [Paenibacillus barengoltzii]